MIEYDLTTFRAEVIRNSGMTNMLPRKSHTAVMYKASMVVYGGCTETGAILPDMIAYQVDLKEFQKV